MRLLSNTLHFQKVKDNPKMKEVIITKESDVAAFFWSIPPSRLRKIRSRVGGILKRAKKKGNTVNSMYFQVPKVRFSRSRGETYNINFGVSIFF